MQVLDFGIQLVAVIWTGTTRIFAISWYDISHQTQVLSVFAHSSTQVSGHTKRINRHQKMVKKIIHFLKLLDTDDAPRNPSICYSNFAVLIEDSNGMEEPIRDLVRAHYNLNIGSLRKLKEYDLHRLKKVWYGGDGGN